MVVVSEVVVKIWESGEVMIVPFSVVVSVLGVVSDLVVVLDSVVVPLLVVVEPSVFTVVSPCEVLEKLLHGACD